MPDIVRAVLDDRPHQCCSPGCIRAVRNEGRTLQGDEAVFCMLICITMLCPTGSITQTLAMQSHFG